MNRIMVVSPHPDDETLGAGGMLLRCKREKKAIFWLNVTNMKEDYGYDQRRVQERNQEIELVRKEFDFDEFCNLELEPAGLEKYSFSDVGEKIATFVRKMKPDTLVLPYPRDAHTDHRAVFDWMMPFSKSFRYPFVDKVLLMEIVSETEFSTYETAFTPNFFVDISDDMDEKIEIMKIYKSEMGEGFFPRSERNIRALGTFRGSIANCMYAEAFRIHKWIW